jgi:hypothetical protein
MLTQQDARRPSDLCTKVPRLRFSDMRELETVDSELRLLAAVRWSIREHGGEPSSRQVDELLDERPANLGRAGEDVAART